MAAKKNQEDKEIKSRKPGPETKKKAAGAAANTSAPKKQAAEVLPKSEDRYRTLVEKAFEGIIVIQDGGIVFANPRAYAIIDHPRDQVAPRAFMDFIHPDDAEIVTDNYLRRLKGEQFEETYPIRLVDQKGNIKWAQISTSLINWEGKPATLTFLTDITERKQKEEALRESETKFKSIIEHSGDVFYMFDLDAKPLYLSPRCLDILGYTVDEYNNIKWTDLLIDSPVNKAAIASTMAAIKTGLKQPTYPVEFLRKDGSRVAAEIKESPLKDDNGKVIGLVGVIRDISERKKAEQALRESEEKYRLIAENARDIIWTMDMNLQFTYMSPSVLPIRGYTVEEVMSQSVEEIFTPSSLEIALKAFEEEFALESMEPKDLSRKRTLELEHIRKDGQTVWVEINVSFLRDTDGQPIGILGVSRDITDRKRAEDEVKRQQAFLRQVIDSNPNLIFVKDRDDRFLLANNTLANAYGTTPAYMQGKTDLELGVPAEEFARYRQDDIEVLQSGKDKIIPDESFTWHSGEVHYYHTTKRPLLGEKGEINSILAVSVDITERKKSEEALRKSEEKYRLLADNASDVIWTADMNLNTTYISPSIYAMQGHTPEEAMNLTVEQRFTPESLEKLSKVFMEAMANEEAGREQPKNLDIIEAEYIRKDGSTYWTETKASFIRDRAGKAVGMLGVTRDISERKRQRKRLPCLRRDTGLYWKICMIHILK